jgi:hypothetical protein
MNKWDEGEWENGKGMLYIDSRLAIVVNAKGPDYTSASCFHEVERISSRQFVYRYYWSITTIGITEVDSIVSPLTYILFFPVRAE